VLSSIVIAAALIVGAQVAAVPRPVVVVVELRGEGGVSYSCNGSGLDPARPLTGIEAKIDGGNPESRASASVFVLVDERVAISTLFELGSLLSGKAGLRQVRYFTFSRKTRVMLELAPVWDRWKLSFAVSSKRSTGRANRRARTIASLAEPGRESVIPPGIK